MIAWQRSINFGKDGTNEPPPKTELDFLMGFLKQEVESEQQRGLARAQFMSEHDIIQESTQKISKESTAASLYVGESDSCVFCGKKHSPHDCGKAMNMPLKSKQNLLSGKEVCQKCLRKHTSLNCQAYTKCSGCYKQHFHIMWPDSPTNKDKSKPITSSSNHNSVINIPSRKQVLLKTILVKIKSRIGEKTVRVLFDDGSQQSYIKTAIVKALKCLEHGRYFERNTLFGGVLSNVEERTVYQVQMESLEWQGQKKRGSPGKRQIDRRNNKDY